MFVAPDRREVDKPPYTHKYFGVIVGYFLEKVGYFSPIKHGGYVMGNTENTMHIKNNLNVIATNFQINIGNAIGKIDMAEGMSQNAIRHILWNALMTRYLGDKQATQASNSHETGCTLNTDQRSFSYTEKEGSLKNAILKADQVADLLNNIIGRRIGLENPNTDNINTCRQSCGRVSQKWILYN